MILMFNICKKKSNAIPHQRLHITPVNLILNFFMNIYIVLSYKQAIQWKASNANDIITSRKLNRASSARRIHCVHVI